jgi:flagellar hook-associated protein FlgK
MKHTLTLHSKDLNITLDEQKSLFDRAFGRGLDRPENEYKISDFDTLWHARNTRLNTELNTEDYGKIYDFLDAVENSMREGFCRVARDLMNTSRTTLDEVDKVKIDTNLKNSEPTEVVCDVPSLHNIVVLLFEGMKAFCHERLWNADNVAAPKLLQPIADKPKAKKKAGKTAKKEKKVEVEYVGFKKTVKKGAKKTKKEA